MEELSKTERRELKRQRRKERKEQAKHTRDSRARRNSAKTIGIVVVIIVLIAAGGFAVSIFTGNAVNAPGLYDEFVKCTAEKGLIMYGAYWCPNCQKQKLDFGNSFRHVNYIECDIRDPEGKGQPALCKEMGVEAYPTWIFNEQRFVGVQSLQRLAEITECEL